MGSSYRTVQAWPTYLRPDAIVNPLRSVMSTWAVKRILEPESTMYHNVTQHNEPRLDRSQC